jgi:hypothetical protein
VAPEISTTTTIAAQARELIGAPGKALDEIRAANATIARCAITSLRKPCS